MAAKTELRTAGKARLAPPVSQLILKGINAFGLPANGPIVSGGQRPSQRQPTIYYWSIIHTLAKRIEESIRLVGTGSKASIGNGYIRKAVC